MTSTTTSSTHKNDVLLQVGEKIETSSNSVNDLKDIVSELQICYLELQEHIGKAQDEHESLQTSVQRLANQKAMLLAEIADLANQKKAAAMTTSSTLQRDDEDDMNDIINDDDDDDSECTDVGTTQAEFEGYSSIGFGAGDGGPSMMANLRTSTSTRKEKRQLFLDMSEESLSQVGKKRLRVSKAGGMMSPKKWRRMMKTHRLQSILLAE